MSVESPAIERVVVSREAIGGIIARLAEGLAQRYGDGGEVTVLVVLEGARRFADDLLRAAARLGFGPVAAEVRAQSYHGGTRSSGKVTLEGIEQLDLAGREVLIVDDIYDTGRTLTALCEAVTGAGARSVATCVLLEKAREHEQPCPCDFVGVRVEDSFLIGYGLDFEGRFRELDYVGVMRV